MSRTWNYRAVKCPYGEDFVLHEVHYDDGGPVAMTIDGCAFSGETIEELIGALEMAISDLKRHGELVPPEEWE